MKVQPDVSAKYSFEKARQYHPRGLQGSKGAVLKGDARLKRRQRKLAGKQSTVPAARVDMLTPFQRSERMSRVRSKDTKPELAVRRVIHRLGFRYRLHIRALPGNPDIVFRKRKAAIFVHGCFWHRHRERCRLTRLPKTKLDYWVPKLERNRKRDLENQRKLRKDGWRVLVIWECELPPDRKLVRRMLDFLSA